MELNEFITNVLFEVTSGIKNANKKVGEGTFQMEAYRRENETGFISFDLAVKTNEATGKDVKGGIQVLNLGVGGDVSNSTTHESANRIKFYIIPGKNIE